MSDLLLLVFFVVAIIGSITLLVFCFKKKNNKLWFILFGIEFFIIILSFFLMIYFDSLPGFGFMPGLTYLGHILLCLGAIIIFAVLLTTSIVSKVIIFELKQKKENKKYFNPVFLILAFVFFGIAFYSTGVELLENWNVKKSIGIVVSFEEKSYNTTINGEVVKETKLYPIIKFYVDGEECEDDIYPSYFEGQDIKVGDIVEIYHKGKMITHKENYKMFYIPCYIISLILVIIRFKDYIKLIFRKRKKDNATL